MACTHAAYFWPNPTVGSAAVTARLKPLIAHARALMTAVVQHSAWTATQDADAVDLAQEVFRWGGVPQSQAKVTPAIIRAVFDSVAARRRLRDAPMNSGWTKLAAVGSAGLPPAQELAI